MGLPDRPPINIAPNLAPLRIPPPGVTLPSMANIQVSGIQTTHIHPHDVLCGRGGGTNNHNGNEKFRELVTQQKVLYLHSSKRDKPFVSRGIVRAVRAQNPPGRFLQKDELTGLWYDIGDQKAREKTSQALREGAPEIRREITVTSTMEPTPPLRPQIIPPSGFTSASPGVQPLAPAMTPNLAQLRQMQLHRKMEDADFANRRAVAALGYPAHLAAMVAAGRGTMGQTGGSMGQHPSHMMGYSRGQLQPHQAHSMTPQHLHAVAAAGRPYPTTMPQRHVGPPHANYSNVPNPPSQQPPPAMQRRLSISTIKARKQANNATARTIMESSSRRKNGGQQKITKRDGPQAKALNVDVSRRLVLAENVAQKTMNGMITDELKEEEHRTSLYLDAGLLGIKPEVISKLTSEGKTEFQIVEKCYSQLKESMAPVDDVKEQRKRKATQSILQKAKVPKFPALGPHEEPLNTTACTLRLSSVIESLSSIGALQGIDKV